MIKWGGAGASRKNILNSRRCCQAYNRYNAGLGLEADELCQWYNAARWESGFWHAGESLRRNPHKHSCLLREYGCLKEKTRHINDCIDIALRACAFCLEYDDIKTGSDNCYIFTNALVYTFSCSNGRELADVLIINGVKAFVGYTEKIQCPLGMDDITSQLVNTFLVSFIQKGKKVKDAVQDLRTAYDKAVYDESLDVFTRGYYQTNRDALVLKGNGELTLEDMLIEENG